MNDKDKIIAKLKEENEYLRSLLLMHNISFEKPKEIKRHLIGNDTFGNFSRIAKTGVYTVGER